MSSISSSSLYSVGSSGGISGLMSGMDTEAMVESMLAGTQGKIDAQEALKQQTEWKQDLYRDVISDINNFYDKYFDSAFDSTLDTNFFSGDIFNTMVSELIGDNLKVLSTSNDASITDYEIIVNQLATHSSLTSSGRLSGDNNIIGGTIVTDADLDKALEKTVAFDVNGTTVAVNLNGLDTEEKIVDRLNSALYSHGVSVDTFEGELRFTANAGVNITVDKSASSNIGLEVTGLNNATTTDNVLHGTAINFNAAPSIDVTLDGVTKTITLGNVVGTEGIDGYTITADNVVSSLNQELKKAFGDYITTSLTAEGAFKFDINIKDSSGNTELGHELKITGSSASIIGVSAGSTSTFNTSKKLSELATGGNFQFTINDVDFSFSADTTVSSMINTINKSSAGVTLQYSTFADKMTMTATNSGSKNTISITQTSGDLLGKLFGEDIASAGNSVSSEQLLSNNIQGKVLDSEYTTKSTELSMTVNGVQHTFTLSEKDDATYTAAEVTSEFSDWLNGKFSSDITYDSATGSLNIAEGYLVEFDANGADPLNSYSSKNATESDLAFALGFNYKDTSNVATANTALSDVYGLDSLTVTGGPTLADITSVGGYNASFSDGSLQISGSGTVTFTSEMAELMGTTSYSFGYGLVGGTSISKGQDAKITVNGVETTRSSNLVSFDGLSLELTSVTEAGDKNTISTTRNDDVIIEAFKSFVEDYNELITKLGDLVNADPEYRDYPPLTDAQKDEMTDREIELWEEKTQVGLLYNDSTIESFLSAMRSLVYTSPDNSSLALYQIGIETSSFFDDESVSGTLKLDEDVLRNALASDADAIADLFTNVNNGLSRQITDIVESVANKSSANPGSLVSLAGVDGMATETDNELTRQLSTIESMIETLNNRYELESTRYWNQFNAMETVLSQYSSQMNYLAQQFGTGY